MSENEFVLVCAGRYYKATARLVFRGLGKKHGLRDDLINMIHERYMVLVHLDEKARSFIYAALARAWVKKTLRVPITFGMEEVLLQDKRGHEQDASNAAKAARNAAASSSNVAMASMNDDEERLAQAMQRAAHDAAVDKYLAYREAERAASDVVRATEIARIGPMMKIPDWVEAVVFFT